MAEPNIGEKVEVLYMGAWIEGKIAGFANAESDPKVGPVRVYTVDTPKAFIGGVSVQNGTMRLKRSE